MDEFIVMGVFFSHKNDYLKYWNSVNSENYRNLLQALKYRNIEKRIQITVSHDQLKD
jgi:hypothetical protein